jgi:putative Mn2+ efflux pump MntP
MTGTSFASIVALALGLAMDATAATAACGVAAPVLRARHFAIVAVYFGGFQALMPLLGWLLAAWIGSAVAAWDHWLAFVLLGGIGAKMIYGAWRGAGAGAREAPERDMFGARVMLGLAVATSIDAFAAGITLPMFEVPIAISLATDRRHDGGGLGARARRGPAPRRSARARARRARGAVLIGLGV